MDHAAEIVELTKLSLSTRFTIMLAWSIEEAGRYIELFKSYEKKPADLLMGRTNPDYMATLSDALTSVRSVNKTDVVTLISTFGACFLHFFSLFLCLFVWRSRFP